MSNELDLPQLQSIILDYGTLYGDHVNIGYNSLIMKSTL